MPQKPDMNDASNRLYALARPTGAQITYVGEPQAPVPLCILNAQISYLKEISNNAEKAWEELEEGNIDGALIAVKNLTFFLR
jgi:hypothetical protein